MASPTLNFKEFVFPRLRHGTTLLNTLKVVSADEVAGVDEGTHVGRLELPRELCNEMAVWSGVHAGKRLCLQVGTDTDAVRVNASIQVDAQGTAFLLAPDLIPAINQVYSDMDNYIWVDDRDRLAFSPITKKHREQCDYRVLHVQDRCGVCHKITSLSSQDALQLQPFDDDRPISLICDNCELSFHTSCVGIHQIPEGQWYCPACDSALSTQPQHQVECGRTPVAAGGPMHHVHGHDEQSLHRSKQASASSGIVSDNSGSRVKAATKQLADDPKQAPCKHQPPQPPATAPVRAAPTGPAAIGAAVERRDPQPSTAVAASAKHDHISLFALQQAPSPSAAAAAAAPPGTCTLMVPGTHPAAVLSAQPAAVRIDAACQQSSTPTATRQFLHYASAGGKSTLDARTAIPSPNWSGEAAAHTSPARQAMHSTQSKRALSCAGIVELHKAKRRREAEDHPDPHCNNVPVPPALPRLPQPATDAAHKLYPAHEQVAKTGVHACAYSLPLHVSCIKTEPVDAAPSSPGLPAAAPQGYVTMAKLQPSVHAVSTLAKVPAPNEHCPVVQPAAMHQTGANEPQQELSQPVGPVAPAPVLETGQADVVTQLKQQLHAARQHNQELQQQLAASKQEQAALQVHVEEVRQKAREAVKTSLSHVTFAKTIQHTQQTASMQHQLEVQEARKQLQASEKQRAELAGKLAVLTKQYNGCQKELQAAAVDKAGLQRLLHAYTVEKQDAIAGAQAVEAKVQQTMAELQQALDKVRALEVANQSAMVARDDALAEKEEAVFLMQAAEADRQQALAQLQAAATGKARLEAQMQAAVDGHASVRHRNQALQAQLAAAQAELAAAKAQAQAQPLVKQVQQSPGTQDVCDALLISNQDCGHTPGCAACHAYQTQLQAQDQEIHRLAAALQQQEAESNALQQEVGCLQRTLAAVQDVNAGLEAELHALQQQVVGHSTQSKSSDQAPKLADTQCAQPANADGLHAAGCGLADACDDGHRQTADNTCTSQSPSDLGAPQAVTDTKRDSSGQADGHGKEQQQAWPTHQAVSAPAIAESHSQHHDELHACNEARQHSGSGISGGNLLEADDDSGRALHSPSPGVCLAPSRMADTPLKHPHGASTKAIIGQGTDGAKQATEQAADHHTSSEPTTLQARLLVPSTSLPVSTDEGQVRGQGCSSIVLIGVAPTHIAGMDADEIDLATDHGVNEV